jgi:hypothetical protein
MRPSDPIGPDPRESKDFGAVRRLVRPDARGPRWIVLPKWARFWGAPVPHPS